MAYKNTIHLEAFYSCVLWDTIPGTMATHEMEFLLTTHPWARVVALADDRNYIHIS